MVRSVAVPPTPRPAPLPSTTTMCRQTGVTMRQASRWMHMGVITPTAVEPVTDRGTCTFVARWDPRLYPTLRLLGQLAANGASTRQVKGAFTVLSQLTAREWHGKLYVSPAGFVAGKQTSPVAHVLDLDRTHAQRRTADLIEAG